MSEFHFQVVRAIDIGPFAEELRELERQFQYPIDDGKDHFFIDHGPDYHPFFSALGDAWFLLARRKERIVGLVVGISRRVSWGRREISALYICDLKIAQEARGRGLSQRMLLHGLGTLLKTPELRQTRFLYGAAMRGARGDVMRSARGINPLRLGQASATLSIYFVSPHQLAALNPKTAPETPASPGINLGPSVKAPWEMPGICTTAGRKDLRLVSTGAPWPLIHLPLGPAAWQPSVGTYLQACGETLVSREAPGQACFSLDNRFQAQREWLADEGIHPGAVCTVYSLSLLLSSTRARWIHLPTSEI